MADPIAGLPYWQLTFGPDGALLDDGGLPAALPTAGLTDLFLLSHGWNTSTDSADGLYQDMFTELAEQIDKFAPELRPHTGMVGLHWPSLLFPDDAPAGPATPSTGAQLATALAPAFAPAQRAGLQQLGTLLDQQPQDAAGLQQAHQLIGALVTSPPLAAEDSGEQAVLTGPTAQVFGTLSGLAKTRSDAEGLPNPFTTLWHGAREALRTASYFEMKNRAGVVGRSGLGPLLGRLGGGVRVHLMGHSFGARLVSFALTGLPAGAATPVGSLTLIQGAFSHFSFAAQLPIDTSRSGFLSGAQAQVAGPLVSTFSAADRAVGWWYPAASMLSHSDSESATDLTYRWGGMGHDGFQQAGANQVDLLDAGTAYGFQAGQFYRLHSDAVIAADQSPFSGAHSDIRHPQVLWAALAAAITR
ncbi:serine-threonine protein kinase [Kitasatospora sp. NPDC002227]|uniref:serine-threonine protein kinase n=1 Tax=Kitasatospora sp. NPDC002227 TaxID=3154773 RepID=UPI003329E13B